MKVLFLAVCYLLMGLIFNWLYMLAWNLSLTELFPVIPKITYWKMYGLWLLCAALIHGGVKVKPDV